MSRKNKISFLVLICFVMILTGCSEANLESLPTETLSPTFTHIPTATITPTTTPTATITATPTSIPTATPDLPVAFSTPFPEPLQKFKAENINQIREIARYGSPVIRGEWINFDGTIGYIATSEGFYVFDLKNNQLINQFDLVISDYPDNFSSSQDGRRFSVVSDGKAQVWDVEQGKIFEVPNIVENRNEPERLVCISADGKIIAVRSEEISSNEYPPLVINLFDIESGEKIKQLPFGYFWDFTFSSNGKWFITAKTPRLISNDSINIYKTSDWSIHRQLGLSGYKNFAGVSPDDRIVLMYDDKESILNIYQIDPWKLIRQINITINRHLILNSIVFSPDANKIGIRREDKISIWEISSGERIIDTNVDLYAKYFVPIEGIVTTHREILNETYKHLDIKKDDSPYRFWLSQISFNNESKSLSLIREYYHDQDYSKKFEYCTISFEDQFNCEYFLENTFLNYDGNVYRLSETEVMGVYEVLQIENNNQIYLGSINIKSKNIRPFWISPDKMLILVSSATESLYRKTELWDLKTGSLIKQWPNRFISKSTYNAEKNIIGFTWREGYGYRDFAEEFVLFDMNEKKIIFNKTLGDISTMDFAKNDFLVYSVAESYRSPWSVDFFLIDLNNLSEQSNFLTLNMNPDANYIDVSFSNDGDFLALGGSDGIIRIYDTASYNEIHQWKAHNGVISYLEFTGPDNLLISASLDSRGQYDGFIKAWGIWP